MSDCDLTAAENVDTTDEGYAVYLIETLKKENAELKKQIQQIVYKAAQKHRPAYDEQQIKIMGMQDKIAEFENDIDTIKDILYEVGGCDGEEDYAKGWDSAVNEIEAQMLSNLTNYKE